MNTSFELFSKNGELRPMSEAAVPLSNIEYQYGFGVYETLRVVNGVPYFLKQHAERLLKSARIIGLRHDFAKEFVESAIVALASKISLGVKSSPCNFKILLIGGAEPQLFILPLNPHFPDKKLYRDGAHCITYVYERPFPQAKTLNMFRSYLAYRDAKEADAYDALLVDDDGCIREGTRTNFFCLSAEGGSSSGGTGKTIVSPPSGKILLGVMRSVVLKIAKENGFELVERDIRADTLGDYEAAFLTSTSARVMPIRSVDSFAFGSRPASLSEFIAAVDSFLADCGGILN